MVYNIPPDLATNDLKELFGEFGKVLSAMVKKPVKEREVKGREALPPKSGMGYVLFEKKEEAAAAMEAANGKFLGPN